MLGMAACLGLGLLSWYTPTSSVDARAAAATPQRRPLPRSLDASLAHRPLPEVLSNVPMLSTIEQENAALQAPPPPPPYPSQQSQGRPSARRRGSGGDAQGGGSAPHTARFHRDGTRPLSSGAGWTDGNSRSGGDYGAAPPPQFRRDAALVGAQASPKRLRAAHLPRPAQPGVRFGAGEGRPPKPHGTSDDESRGDGEQSPAINSDVDEESYDEDKSYASEGTEEEKQGREVQSGKSVAKSADGSVGRANVSMHPVNGSQDSEVGSRGGRSLREDARVARVAREVQMEAGHTKLGRMEGSGKAEGGHAQTGAGSDERRRWPAAGLAGSGGSVGMARGGMLHQDGVVTYLAQGRGSGKGKGKGKGSRGRRGKGKGKGKGRKHGRKAKAHGRGKGSNVGWIGGGGDTVGDVIGDVKIRGGSSGAGGWGRGGFGNRNESRPLRPRQERSVAVGILTQSKESSRFLSLEVRSGPCPPLAIPPQSGPL